MLLLDQEPESSLGGQAHWSLGGLFLVGSPEQRTRAVAIVVEARRQIYDLLAKG